MRPRRKRSRWVAIASAVVLVLSGVAGNVASAAQSVTMVRITGPECEVAMAESGQPAAKACIVLVTSGAGSGGDVEAAAACYVPTGYTHCGSTWVKLESILKVWSVTATATYVRNSSTGKVSWQSVTCTKFAIGYTISIDWCSSYHNGLPDTNYGANFDVSFIYQGSPITVSHGMRGSINGYTGAACCLQSW